MLPCHPDDPPSCSAAAPTGGSTSFPTPIDAVGEDLGRAFGGWNLVFYGGAIAGSVALAFSGADRSIRDTVQQHFGSSLYGNAATLTGYILPLSVAPGVWLIGLAAGDRAATGAGSAAVQSLVVTASTVFVLKVSVGRLYPPEDAHTFRPFQSWSWPFPAWPSGHTSSALSVVASLTGYYGSSELWIPFVGYPIAAAIGMGMLSGDEHWTSDLLAGAVIGQCIGWSIGRAFRARARGQKPPPFSFAPLTAPNAEGMQLEMNW
jgi:membrane-associated phospholipid phosphatase